MLFLRKQHIF